MVSPHDVPLAPESTRFELLSKLGEGSMGVVYAAHDRTRDMQVALKTMRSFNARRLYRFKREFRALGELSHPNIVELYELISEDDQWLLSMELVQGQGFAAYLSGTNTQRGPGARGRNVRAKVSSSVSGDESSLPSMSESQSSEGGTMLDSSEGRAIVLPGHAHPHGIMSPTRALCGCLPVEEIVAVGQLRPVLAQLAQALTVLHRAEIIHRDLKPSNVMVTATGRVVLMDFGVVAELSLAQADPGQGVAVMGTPAYMSPEQSAGRPASAAADWYAFGVMMYRALTGLMPFWGDSASLLRAKRDHEPTLVSELVSGAPPELTRLCMALLARRPQDRPSAPEILAALGVHTTQSSGVRSQDDSDTVFVGREPQLRILDEVYAQVEAGAPRFVSVLGPAGIGKSSLVRHFLAGLSAEGAAPVGTATPLVLTAHCSERESLPYKALDEAIDSLCLYVSERDEQLREQLLPAAFADLSCLFPIVNRFLDGRAAQPGRSASTKELRRRALVVLRQFFVQLARHRPVIVHIEDLQWADADSVPLLAALFSPPHDARLLILATVRVESEEEHRAEADTLDEFLDTLESEGLGRRVSLGGLGSHEQQALLEELAPELEISPERLSLLERQANGHPFLLRELARSLADSGVETEAVQSLEHLLWRRVEGMAEPERTLLSVVAVAGEPLPLRALAAAAELSKNQRERAARSLAIARLVQTSRTTKEPWLDVYQAKIRDAVLGSLDPARIRECARRLATAVEQWGDVAAATLAHLWHEAGVLDKAAHYSLEAGASAASQLAFERAGFFYAQAFELGEQLDEGLSLRASAWAGLGTLGRAHGASEALLESGESLARELEAQTDAAGPNGAPFEEQRARIHYVLGCLLFPRGNIDGCMRHHRAALAAAKNSGSHELMARALGGLGDAEYMRGRMRSSEAHCSEAVALSRAHGLGEVEIAQLALGASCRFYDGDLAGVKRYVRRVLELAAHTGDHRSKAIARLMGAFRYLLRGNLGRAGDWNERFREMLDALGIDYFRGLVVLVDAEIAMLEGRREEAERSVLAGIAESEAGGHTFTIGALYGMRAWTAGDAATRHEALAHGLGCLGDGSLSHDHLLFYRLAIEATLEAREYERVDMLAWRLAAFIEPEPPGLSAFVIERARLLAAYGRGVRDRAHLYAIERLHAKALNQGYYVAAKALAIPELSRDL